MKFEREIITSARHIFSGLIELIEFLSGSELMYFRYEC